MEGSTLNDATPVRMRDLYPGDTVLVRAKVVRAQEGVGALVEIFSKTDHYDVWVREDLIEQAGYLELDLESGDLVRAAADSDTTWMYLPDPDAGTDAGEFLVLTGDGRGRRRRRSELPARLEKVGPAVG